MEIYTFDDIKNSKLNMEQMIAWTRQALELKGSSVLPPKISLKPTLGEFFNFMPCIIPEKNIVGVKVVSRHISVSPSIKSAMMLFSLETGDCLALMDADYITMARTGIMAALSVFYLGVKSFKKIAIIGLGNTTRASVDAISCLYPDRKMEMYLMAYKGQEESFIERFSSYKNINFHIVNDKNELFDDADIIISGVSYADGLLGDVNSYKPGVLIVPIHTRGFQNCDDVFDLIVADDIPHISGFGKFSQMRKVVELGDVISGKSVGRSNDTERIIAYNIGIGLLDVYFGSMILESINGDDVEFDTPCDKFWW